MKKFLLFLAMFLFWANNVFGNLITLETASTVDDFTMDFFNHNLLIIANEINGGLDTDNLATGAVTSQDISLSANPLTRDFYNIGEYVYTGLTIATSATLASTITAGTAFIANDGDSTLHMVNTDATAKTFTASRDTYVYLDYAGAFSYNVQLNGAAVPATPINSIAIAKVVTSAAAITSVTDRRQTTPTNLRVYQNYKNGLVLSRDVTTATKVTIGPGELEFGTTGKVRRNTAGADVNFVAATNGIGYLDTGNAAANTFYYILAVPDPDSDTAFKGIASLSSSDASGVTGERLIGWCYTSSATVVSPDSMGAYRYLGGDAPNYAVRSVSGDAASLTGGNLQNIPGLILKFVSSGRPVKLTLDIGGQATGGFMGLNTLFNVDGIDMMESEQTSSMSQAANWRIYTHNEFVMPMLAGEHTIIGKFAFAQGTDTINPLMRRTLKAEEY